MPRKSQSRPDPRIEKAKQLLSVVNDGLSREDFTTSFKNVVAYVKNLDANLTKNVNLIAKSLASKLTEVQVNHEATKQLSKRIDTRLETLKDGYTPLKGIDYFDGEKGEPGENGSPDTPEQIKAKLASLEGEDRIGIEHVHGLSEVLNEVKNTRIADQTAIGVQRPGMVVLDLSASLNGSTTTFNTQAFQKIHTVFLSSYPNILRAGIDFSTASSPPSITFLGTIASNAATILASGQTCILLCTA